MKLLLLSILIFVGPSLAFAGEKALVANFVDGRATITKHVVGGDLKVTVKTIKTGGSPFKEGFRWGGEDSVAPPTLIALIAVQSGEDKLFVPLSAYSDLGDPSQISLKSNGDGFELVIAGGDAGVAYNAVLVFEKGWLIRRRVVHGEFPDEAWEETKYSYNTLDS